MMRLSSLELWIMKTYGVVGSWTKVLQLTDQFWFGSYLTVLGFRKNGEVLLQPIGAELDSLDLNSLQMKHLDIQADYGFSYVDSYVESLVLLDKGVVAGSVSTDAINHANDSSEVERGFGRIGKLYWKWMMERLFHLFH
ncbi:hypothetical protein PTKIN_Ptkin14bG0106900 [Pterospermum kingtungense]